MNVLSLFDGMSCGQLALDKLGINVENYFACEIKKHAMKVTQHNYPNTHQLGDVTKVSADNLPKIDLLIGGSPCQDLSQANKERKGINGAKSGLFYEYVRLLKECKPKYFLLENVRMKKEHQDIISSELGVQPIVINSEVVSGQLRHRLYWTNIPFYGNLENRDILLSDVIESGWTDRDKSRCLLESDSRPLSTPVKMFHRYYATGFTTLIFKSKQHYLDCKNHYEANYRGMKASDIVCNSDVYNGVRYLTQSELEKLQTVPSGYTSILDRNQASCLLGDGWTISVIVELLRGIGKEPIKPKTLF
jgi:DNA (cytosine-5)-methyltransferase 3A